MALLAREPNGGFIVLANPTATVHLNLIVALAAQHQLPAIYPYRYFVGAGGLLKTAKALGLDVPPTLLARTDEVIE